MYRFEVKGMTCNHCVAAVTRSIKALDAEADVRVDLAQGKVEVESVKSADALAEAIADAGYEVAGHG